ncbi:phage holin family protein [Rhizobium sp. SSA_523]|uniref:phage holin family protein n=1 Tax=Rhizobium sp. SSA_523 TaxID=2952477 RepID=UPI0020919BE6|nr:phage holin family protein [Rhizobium sp. SSA_523]MCO5732814.1 phage holin family protein [Rhizobium sp. SSA_523]WKC23568.1 phage holin family protein [Rhizobium sp. SSA_523]
MSNTQDNRSLSELVTGLVGDISGLFRKEIHLAKAEVSEKMTKAMHGVEALIAGVIFAIGAVGVLLAALVSGLAAFLVARGFAEHTAESLSAVVVGVVIALVAWGMISRGLSALKGENLSLDRTTTSLRRDAQVLKERS